MNRVANTGRLEMVVAAALLAALLMVVIPQRAAHAATFTVDSTTDAVDANPGDGACATAAGECTLRAAVQEANATTGADTITVPAMAISLSSTLEINSPIEVVGSGAQSTILNGTPGSGRVLLVTAGQVTLRDLTIQRGDGFVGGGVAVGTGSTVEISDALIVDNNAFSQGGGLAVQSGATVTVRRTTIGGNSSAQGGGIANHGTLRVHESLIGGDPPPQNLPGPTTGNTSTRFGGVVNGGSGILNLRNTTVSGNGPSQMTSAATGGITNFGFAFLNNVTITRNTGVGGGGRTGGLSSPSGATTVVKNSIIADNLGSEGATNDCSGALSTDSVYNLIGDPTGCGLPPIEQPPDPETFILNEDPKLGELAINGGPTRNHLPAPESPVIDAGSPLPPGGPADDSCEPIDQRGVERPQDGDGDGTAVCDIGAVELEAPDGPEPPKECTIEGTSGSDTLTGTLGDDVVCGLGGNDTLRGLRGEDVLRGGDGDDTLEGGLGDDSFEGDPGSDTAAYPTARVPITASLDTGTATEGADTDALAGIENLTGSPNDDTLHGSGGANRLSGLGGSDALGGRAGNDSVIGGSGADELNGAADNDALNSRDGVSGNDRLNGGPGTDTRVTDAREASIVGFP